MLVEIVNLTDGPGKKPIELDIYGRILAPGGSIKIPAELIDRRLRAQADAGQISIGPVPSWYAAAKVSKRRTPKVEAKKIPPAPPAEPAKREEKGELPRRSKRKALELVTRPDLEDDATLDAGKRRS